MNTLALYCRASNDDGSLGESATIQNQRDLLRHYIQSRPEFKDWNVLEFQDDGWSGTTFDRPGIQKLLELAGIEIQCIVVKDFSRFGRNLIEVGNYLDQIFPFLGVRFIAVNENYDSKDNAGRTIGLDVSLRAMVYEMYSRDLSKKISSVKEAQMKKGQYAGSWAFYGYQKSTATKSGLEIDPEAAKTVRRIFSLAAAGIKTFQIAVLLNQEGVLPPLSYRRQRTPVERFQCPTATEHNLWTQKRIASIIQDERYTGVLISKKRRRIDISTKKTIPLERSEWIRVENALDAIISKAEYEQAQTVLLSRTKRISTATDLFNGFLKCGHCGKALERIPCKIPYYRCATGRYEPDSPCAHIRIARNDLELAVITGLKHQIQLVQTENPHGNVEEQESTISQKLEKADTEIKKYKSEQITAFEKFADGRLERNQFLAYKEELAQQIEQITRQKEQLLEQLQCIEASSQTQLIDLGKYAFVKTLTRGMLEELVKQILFFPDNTLEIIWNFQTNLFFM